MSDKDKCPKCGVDWYSTLHNGKPCYSCGTRQRLDGTWCVGEECWQHQLTQERGNAKDFKDEALAVEANFCLGHVPKQGDKSMPCPCCENKRLREGIQQIIARYGEAKEYYDHIIVDDWIRLHPAAIKMADTICSDLRGLLIRAAAGAKEKKQERKP